MALAQLVAFGFRLHGSKRNLLHGAEQCSVPLVVGRSRGDSEDQGPQVGHQDASSDAQHVVGKLPVTYSLERH